MINKNKILVSIGILIGSLLLMCFVSASAGLSLNYFPGHSLYVESGKTVNVEVGRIIATSDLEDRTVEVSIEGDIAVLDMANSVVVPAGNKEKIMVKVSIPEGTSDGTELSFVIKIKDVTSSNEEGMVGFAEANQATVPVKVGIEPGPGTEAPTPSENSMIIIWILVIAVILIVVIFFIYKKMISVDSESVKDRRK